MSDDIKTRPATAAYREGWERVFGGDGTEPSCPHCGRRGKSMGEHPGRRSFWGCGCGHLWHVDASSETAATRALIQRLHDVVMCLRAEVEPLATGCLPADRDRRAKVWADAWDAMEAAKEWLKEHKA